MKITYEKTAYINNDNVNLPLRKGKGGWARCTTLAELYEYQESLNNLIEILENERFDGNIIITEATP